MALLPVKSKSAWNAEELEAYLTETRNPLRLGVVTRSGPLVVPLWFLLDDTGLWCASKRDSFIVRTIGSGTECGFDISDNTIPYRGVRGQGAVTLVDAEGERVLRALIDRYLPNATSDFARWLLADAYKEVAILITPDWLTAWDFRLRMKNLANK